ncbi:MAG TPA: SDR family NAD(P)-dependent oxidoreductase, partial [Acetobacteraceae bacterium]
LLTGASSGIGAALAQALARPGATLHVSGRDQGRLAAVAGRCRERGATIASKVLDVRHAEAMADWVQASGPLDLVVANAGISGRPRDGGHEQAELTRAIFDTNLGGVLNTVLPAMAVMARQPPGEDGIRGRIAAVASIAAFIAAPDSPAYCASKAAVDGWMVATAPAARRQGLLLTSICPGFIRTAMTAGYQFPMPGLMDAERAASIILRGLAAGRMRVAFPWWMGVAARAAGLLPPPVIGVLRRRA